ncbi:MAG: cyclic dehypoxanthinyl futalosine synthase [Planctomycetota bacterium]
MHSNRRLSKEAAVDLLKCRDLVSLGRAADGMRRSLHPEGRVTFVVDRNINYTNICSSQCSFCAFWRLKDGAYVITEDELARKIRETTDLGGTQILLQGGLHPELKIDFYVRMLRFIKRNFDIHIHGFSPPEIIHIAGQSGMDVPAVLGELREAGLDTIPGGGAEILSERVRSEVSPHKCTASEWLGVMRTAHSLGMRTTATMMFGHVETVEERAEHFEAVRSLQDETGGFTAFIPWTFQPLHTRLERIRPAGAFEYLRVLAVSRLYLDNIENIQASWVTQGAKVAQVALRFGANDMGSTMIEENVVRAAGVDYRISVDEIVRIIREAGFRPARRDCYYNVLEEV